MKKKTLLFAGSVILLFMISCSSVSVKSDYDPGVDFSQYKTFTMYTGKTIPGDELVSHPLIKKRVDTNVKEELERKGFKLVDESDADFVVVTHAGVKEKTQVTNWGGGGYGYGWYDPWWGPYGSRVDVNQYEESTLVIDIVGGENKQMLWRGMGTGIVKEYSSPEDQNENVKKYVTKILTEFPPTRKK